MGFSAFGIQTNRRLFPREGKVLQSNQGLDDVAYTLLRFSAFFPPYPLCLCNLYTVVIKLYYQEFKIININKL